MSERKLIADIFASIDNRSDANVEEIGKQIGSAWDVIYKENRSKAIRRTVSSSGDTGEHSGKNLKIQTIFSGGDLYGFVPASSTDYIGLRYSSLWQRPVLYAELSPESASDGAGIVSNSIKLKDIKDAGYLGVVAMVSASRSDLVNITVRLSGYTKNGTEKVLVCNSRAESGSWFELYYDVADFIKDIKSEDITLAVLASSCESGGEVESLWLSEIKTESPIRTGMPVWLIVVLIVLAVGGALAGFIIWFTKNYTFVRE